MSACIQTRGYFKVDVINEDMPTLRNLERGNLYRNYIWREVRIMKMMMIMIMIMMILMMMMMILMMTAG